MNEKMLEIRKEITENLMEAIKKGTAPWQRPWEWQRAPRNGISGHLYSGINQIYLTVKGEKIDGGADPRWITFLQARENN